MEYNLSLGEKINKIKEKYKNEIEIDANGCLRVTDRVKCKCKVCGHEWTPKLWYLIDNRGCAECSRKKRLNDNNKERIRNAFDKCVKYAKDKGYEIIDVFQKGKFVYVKYYNHNKDKNGNVFGENTMFYYSFINGAKSKKEFGDSLKLTTEEWVKKAQKVHPEYDYTKTQYINNRKSVIVTCKEHGDFSVQPKVFIKKDYKCEKCKKKRLKDEKLDELGRFLKNTYPYIKLIEGEQFRKHHFVCDKHGEFWQSAENIYKGITCPLCGREQSIKKRSNNTDIFIEKAKKMHGDKYDYSKVEYKNSHEKVCIICHDKDEFGIEHGEFWQMPSSHLGGQGCPKCCGGGGSDYKGKIFLERMKNIHPEYDFSNTVYNKTHDKVEVKCTCKDEFGNEHGVFYITPHNLLAGYGCKKCSNTYMDKELFVNRSNKIHDYKYDYSDVEYINNHTKVCIKCPEHGEFWQIPNAHLLGKGCSLCKTSHFEREMDISLKNNGLNYIYQYHDKENLGKQSLDFYFPDKKIGIECQGEQHFIPNFFKSKGVEYAEKHLEYIKELDKKKREICKELGITLIYYLDKKFEKYMEKDFIYFTDKDDVIKYIKKMYI